MLFDYIVLMPQRIYEYYRVEFVISIFGVVFRAMRIVFTVYFLLYDLMAWPFCIGVH